jgi:hypothetical protein
VTIPNICPFTPYRPLSNDQTEPRIVPRLLIYHTMVGYLKSTERYFKDVNGAGFSGPESTWGVGGSWDGDLDGVGWQWQGLLYQADANFDPANNYANSVETSDGGHYPTPPWGAKQMGMLIRIGAWWCHAVGQEPVIAKAYNGHGLGYHQQFAEWNKGSHNCPGPLRRAQFYDELVPGIVKAYNGGVTPPPPDTPDYPRFPLPSGYYFGPADGGSHSISGLYSYKGALSPWQRQMRNRGWDIGVDGIYGPETRDVALSFQQEKRLEADGLIGPETWRSAWTLKVT